MRRNSFGLGRKYLAKYTEQELEDYQGNPLIESLPPIWSEEEVIEMLRTPISYRAAERKLPPEKRGHCVEKLFKLFEPLEKHLDLEQKLSRVIRQGYINRNPLFPEYASQLHKTYRIIKSGQYEIPANEEVGTSALGFSIIGFSGVGKTKGIEKILSLYPQLFIHSKYRGIEFSNYQLVWLKIDSPHDGSQRGLCIEFFRTVDRILGSDYLPRFVKSRSSTNDLLGHMAQLAYNHCLGVLVIDEIQHLSLAKSGGSDKLLNFLVTLVNTIGVPVVLIGTNKAVSVLQGQFRQARRGTGQGSVNWERMYEDNLWDLFIESIWEYQWTEEETPLTDELKHVLYDESQGIIDIAVKIYAIAQWELISVGKGQITPTLIKKVCKDNLHLLQPMLDALRSNDIKLIAKYEDIMPIDIDEIKERYLAKISNRRDLFKRKANKESEQQLLEEIVVRLMNVNIDASVATAVAKKVIKEGKTGNDIEQIAGAAIQLAFSLNNNSDDKIKKTSKVTGTGGLNNDDMRTVDKRAEVSGKDILEQLEEEDVTIPPLNELF